MDTEKINAAIEKLKEINKVVIELDPAIRLSAFQVLEPLYFENAIRGKGPGAEGSHNNPTADFASFCQKFESDKQSENVHMIAAWLYSQYGVFPMTNEHLHAEADAAGVLISERADNIMRDAKDKDGRLMYVKKGEGWQLTARGKAYMLDTYNVRKGTKRRPMDELR